jgi:hypothetical protein
MFTEIMDLRFAIHTKGIQTQYENGTKQLFINANKIYILYTKHPVDITVIYIYLFIYSQAARN